jgi:hypothetical protein
MNGRRLGFGPKFCWARCIGKPASGIPKLSSSMRVTTWSLLSVTLKPGPSAFTRSPLSLMPNPAAPSCADAVPVSSAPSVSAETTMRARPFMVMSLPLCAVAAQHIGFRSGGGRSDCLLGIGAAPGYGAEAQPHVRPPWVLDARRGRRPLQVAPCRAAQFRAERNSRPERPLAWKAAATASLLLFRRPVLRASDDCSSRCSCSGGPSESPASRPVASMRLVSGFAYLFRVDLQRTVARLIVALRGC